MADKQFQDFPVPRLDDRSFQELMDEMRALIPVYCPEWTNHNPSDPGITLLELFAFLTETMLYRLNRVPVRNLFALLNLMGIQPQAPSPARTQLVITPSPGAHGEMVPAGTPVSSQRSGDGEPLLFETDFPIMLTTAEISTAITHSGQETREVTALLTQERPEAFEPFGGVAAKDQFLYVSDPRILTLKEEGMRIHLKFFGASAHRDLYARWNWQTFDGTDWIPARLAVGHGRGEVILESAPDLVESEVGGHAGPWIRAVPLVSEEDPEGISFEDVQVEVSSAEEGVSPHAAFLNQGGESLFSAIDLSRTFWPLGEFPRQDACLYVMAKELFRAAGTRVELVLTTADVKLKPRPEASSDLSLVVEFPVPGGMWRPLGTLKATMFGRSEANKYQLEDSTWGLTRGGVVSFIVPSEITPISLQGQEGHWIRIRLAEGQYLGPPQTDESANRPLPLTAEPVGPHFLSLKLRSRAVAAQIQKVMSYSDFTTMELWTRARPRGTAVHPFPRREEYVTALYLGLSRPFPFGTHGVFFKIADDGEAYSSETEVAIAQQKVAWEYLSPTGFKPLPYVEDATLHLKRDGFVIFDSPEDGDMATLFERQAFWIRARLVSGRYDIGPRIEDIRLNAVGASNVQTIQEQRILPSDGLPFQEVELRRSPVVGSVNLWVFERERPRDEELNLILEDLGQGSMFQDDDGYWFRWREVEHFLYSGPKGRHFRLDRHNGVVRFGDGRDGMIPPPRARAIRVEGYTIGGGLRGNVGPGVLTVLKESLSAVARVTNPFAAEGGAESEGVIDAARRGTASIYSVDRAIRAADFERLTYQASRRVAKVYCLGPQLVAAGAQPHPEDGAVRVLILPELPDGPNPMRRKLIPSPEIVRRVERYLEDRRPINVKIGVRGPRYRSFSIEAALYVQGRMSQALEEEIRGRLFNLVHPLYGGPDGRGWKLGQSVPRAGLYQILGGVPEVLSVVSLRTFDNRGSEFTGSLDLGDDELPFLTDVKLKAAHLA